MTRGLLHRFERRSWLLAAATLLLLAAVALYEFQNSRKRLPAVVLLPFTTEIFKPKSRLSQAVAPWWSWLKFRLFGPSKVITLASSIVEFENESVLTNLGLGANDFSNAEGVRVWIISEDKLEALRRGIRALAGAKIIAQPRVVTGDRVESQMFVGTSILLNGTNQSVGLLWKCLPHLRRGSIDLTSVLADTEAIPTRVEPSGGAPGKEIISNRIQTNCAIAARFQIPTGRGVFLIQQSKDVPTRRVRGVMLLPSIQQPKK